MLTQVQTAVNQPATDYLDGFIDETTAADFLCQSIRTIQKWRVDAMLSGLFITRAAISDVPADEFEEFMERHVEALQRLIEEHSVPVEDRISKARARYRLS